MVKIKDTGIMSYNFKVFTIMFIYDSPTASALEFSESNTHEDLRFIMFYCKHVLVFQIEFDFRMGKVKILEHLQ